jgi:tetratricopeptide (TPR) repeat protein
MTTTGHRPFRPAWGAQCLCGSGKRYRDCCRTRLPGRDIGEAWRVDADRERWGAAILSLRADVTQYTIWHIDHTAPFKGGRTPMFRGKSLLKIDVEALSEYVDRLMRSYILAGRHDSVAAMLDRLACNIDDPSWLAKIAYHKAMDRLLRGDRPGAASELAKVGGVTPQSDDVDLLQAHLDLHGSEMGLTETLAFMDRVLELTTSRSDRLQYGGARAFQLILANDPKGGHDALLEVVRIGREMEAEKPFGNLSQLWFCRALEGVAVETRDETMFEEVIRRLTPLRDGDELTRKGRAHVGRSIGDAFRYWGRYERGIEAYRLASELEEDGALITFEAECRLRLGDGDGALTTLGRVNVPSLPVAEFADYAFTYFYVAMERTDRGALEMALDLLKRASTPQPYFETMRLTHIVTTQDALAALAAQKSLPKAKGLSVFLRSMSRYVQLQPNFNGVGINLNNVLEDVADRLDKDPRPSPYDRLKDEASDVAISSG